MRLNDASAQLTTSGPFCVMLVELVNELSSAKRDE